MESFSDYSSLIDLVDIAAMVVIAICALIGIGRGLSGELAGMVSAVAGFVLGVVFFSSIVAWLAEYSRLSYESARLVTFAVVFLVAISVMLVLRLILRLLLKLAIDSRTDRVGGGIAGGVKGAVIVLAVYVLMILSPMEAARTAFGEESMIGALLIKFVPELRNGAGLDMELTEEGRS